MAGSGGPLDVENRLGRGVILTLQLPFDVKSQSITPNQGIYKNLGASSTAICGDIGRATVRRSGAFFAK